MPTNHPELLMERPGIDMHGAHQEFGDEEEGGGFDLQRYANALLRFKWLILGLGLAGLGVGYGLSRVVKPVYEAQATIHIDGAVRGQQDGPGQSARLLEARGWIDLILSFRVLDEVVRRQHLYVETPEPADKAVFAGMQLGEGFTPGIYRLSTNGATGRVELAYANGSLVSDAAPGDSLGQSVGLLWTAPQLRPGQTIAFTLSTPRDAAVKLGRDLITNMPPENASFMGLALRGEDPVVTTGTVNAVAERFVEVATILKREKLTTYTTVLRDQLASAYAELRTAESELQSFRVSTITLPSDRGATQVAAGLAETRDPVRNAFFQLRIERDALVLDRDAITRALRSASDSSSALLVSLGAIRSVRETPELSLMLTELSNKRAEARSLRLAFADTYRPLQDLDNQIADLTQRAIPAQATRLTENLEVRIREYDERIAASAAEMRAIPTRAIEETRRESDLDIKRTIHTELRSAYEQAKLAELSAAPDVRIMDRADVPTRPVTDQLMIIIIGGLLGGLGLGIGLAILFDRVDHRLRYPDQVTRDLGLPILGALPLLRNRADGKAETDDDAYLVEALRSVRMNLAYAHGAAGAFVTTITSPGPGDGKSFTSVHLARSFARSGRRTLVIDGDTRRGHLHRTLGGSRRPGLLDYLAGEVPRESIVQSIPEWGFDFIGSGKRSAGGPELLASTTMSVLVMQLRTEYGAIIIDSPPLGAGVDPLVLASLTGSLVMVLRAGVTDRDLAEARLHELNRLPIRVLGAILNDVKPEGMYRYYSYLPGYRAEDETELKIEPARSKSRRKG